MPTHVRIKSSPIPSIALCEQIETVYKKRIGKYLAKAMQILETAKPVPIQIPERLFDKERIKELEKDLIRAEAERDVFQKLYKEQLAIS